MSVYYENTSGESWWPKCGETNVKMLIGKLLTIHFQTWDLVGKWREISWVRAYFWSVVCYHSCILNSYSKFKERETQFLSFSLHFLQNFHFLLFSPSITIISLSLFLFHFSFLISSFIYICVLIFSFFLCFFQDLARSHVFNIYLYYIKCEK